MAGLISNNFMENIGRKKIKEPTNYSKLLKKINIKKYMKL